MIVCDKGRVPKKSQTSILEKYSGLTWVKEGERVDESPRQDENFGTFGLCLAFFVTELRPFKVKSNFAMYF